MQSSSLFSYGFASTQTCPGSVGAAAIGSPKEAAVENTTRVGDPIFNLQFGCEGLPLIPHHIFFVSVVILSCSSAVSHELVSEASL